MNVTRIATMHNSNTMNGTTQDVIIALIITAVIAITIATTIIARRTIYNTNQRLYRRFGGGVNLREVVSFREYVETFVSELVALITR